MAWPSAPRPCSAWSSECHPCAKQRHGLHAPMTAVASSVRRLRQPRKEREGTSFRSHAAGVNDAAQWRTLPRTYVDRGNVRVILNYPPPYTWGPPYSSEVCPPAPRGGYLHPPTGRTACAAQDHTPPQVRELGLGGLAPGPGARALGRGAVIGSILRVGAGGPRVCSGGRGPCGAWGGAWGWDRGCICRERWEPRRGFSGDALYTPLQLRGLPT